MNPNQLIQMIQAGKNPQQLMMGLLQSQMGNTPMGKNLLNLAQNNDTNGIELVARNICQSKGINFDTAFGQFKQQLGLN